MPQRPRCNETPWFRDNPIQQRMLQDMGSRNLTLRTQKEYLRWIGKSVCFENNLKVVGAEQGDRWFVGHRKIENGNVRTQFDDQLVQVKPLICGGHDRC